ncbi:MAG: SH3 domain-containing protein, partial [Campylobacterales bacterium]|nr:SH3 domain-containing protein [Campylobacterales bacterium]
MLKYTSHVLLFILLILLSGCSLKDGHLLQDIKNYPQYVEPYLSNIDINLTIETQLIHDKEFNDKFFSPWSDKNFTISANEAFWAFNVYTKSKSYYGENRVKIESNWFDIVLNNANLSAYNTLNKKAISIKNSQIRDMPTNKPLFLDFDKAGEGYPFDYLQNTLLKANTPILISHYTLDGSFAFIKTHFGYGWIDSRDIAYIDEVSINLFKSSKLLVVIQDNIPIKDYLHEEYLFYAKVGTIFPISNITDDGFEILVAKKGIDKSSSFVKSYISKKNGNIKPISFTKENIAIVGNSLLNENYGWGGYLENRDCSSLTQDFFAPFGIWLPRNSKAQSTKGAILKLENLTNDEKVKLINRYAIPFMTLVYLKGHVMLYIGSIDGTPIVLHNT